MARNIDTHSFEEASTNSDNNITFNSADGSNVTLPDTHNVGDASLSRDGQDLTLSYEGQADITISNYFTSDNDASIQDAQGGVLTNGLVDSFLESSPEYAQNMSMSDISPIGAVEEVSGGATVTRLDGTTEPVNLGTEIYQGDVVQTTMSGAVNIAFTDESSLAISENAKMAIDNYNFQPETESGATNVSVLRGVFVYTSGLIGRDDPDDVSITTPVGSIGIRGTIIAGSIKPDGESEISVLEGAIVVTNGAGEMTLSQQFETIKLLGFNQEMEMIGVQPAETFAKTYGSVSDVLPKLFSSINDNAPVQDAQEQEEQTLEEETREEDIQGNEAQEIIEDSIQNEGENSDNSMMDSVSEMIDDMSFDEGTMDLNDAGSDTVITTNSLNDSIKEFINENGRFNIQEFIANKIFLKHTQQFEASDNTFIFEGADAGAPIAFMKVNSLTNVNSIIVVDNAGAVHNDYEIVDSGDGIYEVVLKAGGATLPTEGTVYSDFTIKVVNSDLSTQIIKTYTNPVVLDAKVNIDLPDTITDFGYGDYETGNGNADFNKLEVDVNKNGFPNEVSINGAGDVVIEGISSLSNHNYTSVDSLGDINNDGYDDIIAGTSEYNSSSGKVVIIEGDNGGTQNPYYVVNPTPIAGDLFGNDVAGIGDFNGDGHNDFIIGAANNQNAGNAYGSVFIHTTSTSYTQIHGDGSSGNGNNQDYGRFVDGIGDFDGDGKSDIMVGYKDGVQIILSSASITNGMTQTSIDQANVFDVAGTFLTASSVGDFNGDGFDDFAVSMQDVNDVNTYVVYGHKEGNYDDLTLVDLENPDNALKIDHHDGYDASYSITAIGDIDGDGYDDIQIGYAGNYHTVNGHQGGGGINYVTDGSVGDGNAATNKIDVTDDNQSVVGSAENDTVILTGTHTDAKFSTGAGNDTIQLENSNFVKIDGGTGHDTISFIDASNGANLDFSNFKYEHIKQIEEINFGHTTQTITLNIENIFNMLKTSDDNTLTISGAGTLNLNEATNDIETELEAFNGDPNSVTDHGSTGGLTHYQIGGYDLYIEDTVNVV